MTEPCQQQWRLATLEAKDTSIQDTLREIRQDQKRLIELLERIAAQGARIDSLEENVRKHGRDIGALFGRVRDIEIAPGKEGTTVKNGAIMAIIAAVISFIVAKVLR
jgi:hypothetical protein